VTKDIESALDSIWTATRRRPGLRRDRRRKDQAVTRPKTKIETLREVSIEAIRHWRRTQPQESRQEGGGNQPTREPGNRYLHQIMAEQWKQRWKQEAGKPHRKAATWTEGWDNQPLQLYDAVPKHVATAIFLLRSQVLGLKGWLADIGVPGVTPNCTCGAPRQTLQHVLAFCRDQIEARNKLIRRAGSTDLLELLKHKDTAPIAGRWLIDTGLLDQFRVADEVENTDTREWTPFQPVHTLHNPSAFP